MALAPLRYCATPCCATKVRQGHCAVHRRDARPNWDVRKWYRISRWCHPQYGLRAQVLREQPLCDDCEHEGGAIELSTDVDHTIPHRGNPALFWDRSNLRGKCKRHHSLKTGRGL